MDASAHNDQEMHRELERMTAAIDRYASQLEHLNGQIVVIDEENENDDVNRQIKEYEATMAKQDKSEIAAEDALDNLVRMQNQLKIVRRRNQLLARENNTQERQLSDRAKVLKKTSDELDAVCDATGWSGDFSEVDFDEVNEHKAGTHDMLMKEQEVRQDLKSTKLIIKKKEDAIVSLTQHTAAQRERQTYLNQLNNDIRVAQRDTHETELRVQRLHSEDAGIDRALVEVKENDDCVANSVVSMENDKEFLTEAVTETRLNCRRQDNVIRAQMARQEQLQKRLETVMKSLREMKLEKEFERNVAKSGLVPSASREEPDDVSQILPEEEWIPVDTYRLLYKNNEMMHTNVARKNMLVLEKQSVIQAMDAKLRSCVERHNMNAQKDDGLRMSKNIQVDGLMGELQASHRNYSAEIEVLQAENKKMKVLLSNKIATMKREMVQRRQGSTRTM